VCELRDVKRLYAKARRGEVKGVTASTIPTRSPSGHRSSLDTVRHTPEENADEVVRDLVDRGFLPGGPR
jgi:adenylylsulfate kinase-like enzyme